MEFCNSGDLSDYLHAKGTLSEDTISFFLRQISRGLKAMVNKGIVHRDLKPQNILLQNNSCKKNPDPRDMTLKIGQSFVLINARSSTLILFINTKYINLYFTYEIYFIILESQYYLLNDFCLTADFGFARFLGNGAMAATLCGSPMYMAPEVIMSLQYDNKADLWSIGTIVYQCLTGKAPFAASTPSQLKQFYERSSNLAPHIPTGTSEDLSDLLLRILKRNARERINFDDFFNHRFIKEKSAPVAVPNTRSSRTSLSSNSPSMKTISVSPLSGMPGRGNASAPRKIPGSEKSPGSSGRTSPASLGGFTKVEAPVEDFVLVPENLPQSYAELQAIFPENYDDIEPTKHKHRSAPYAKKQPSNSPGRNRPHSLPFGSKGSSPGSLVKPVPTQIENYEKMQLSRSLKNSPSSPSSLSSTSSSLIRRRKNSIERIDIESMSPPTAHFTIGTPPDHMSPGLTWRRNSGSFGSSPRSRSGMHAAATSPSSLPTIAQSPTKVVSKIDFESHMERKHSETKLDLPSGGRVQLSEHQKGILKAAVGQNALVRYESDEMKTPYLTDELLLNNIHNELVNRLDFATGSCEYIMQLAEDRSSPVLENANEDVSLSFMNEHKQKIVELLALYLRVINMLQNVLSLTAVEHKNGRLQVTPTVVQIIRQAHTNYKKALKVCSNIKRDYIEKENHAGFDYEKLSRIADKVIYQHVVDLCRSAPMQELMGRNEESFQLYKSAQILLQHLSQHAKNDMDKETLIDCK
ncbi:DgyrCDS14072 [Dimorphilus gyrociliatus]|uniref:DgyrCDS14072 n=1 Tax=Dimorphilus gyrociliatus TaxID=2664684 RepID=A0A7I8WCU8_9ANNE|nr:DgyrCDS14072 [Dimorphilus gyrociliatus]